MQAAAIKAPKLWDSPLAALFDMADRMREKAGQDVIFKLPDIQSPMDISALIWDKNEFYIAILEEPQAVMELSHKVFKLLTEFLDEWFKRYGKSFVSHYPNYYMQQGVTLSEDEIGVISPEIFRKILADLTPYCDVWMVGDNLIADVAGAETVGIHSILVRSDNPGVRRYAESLKQVPKLLGGH
jgi:hypothetical protein